MRPSRPIFHNFGDSYDSAQSVEVRATLERARGYPNQVAAAEFNRCKNQEDYCAISISASSENLRDPQKPIYVQILGDVLAFPSPWISPEWTQNIVRPYISFFCGSEHYTVILESSLGSWIPDDLRLNEESVPNRRLQTPFGRDLRAPCKRTIDKIELGFQSAKIQHQFSRVDLSGEHKSIDLGWRRGQ